MMPLERAIITLRTQEQKDVVMQVETNMLHVRLAISSQTVHIIKQWAKMFGKIWAILAFFIFYCLAVVV